MDFEEFYMEKTKIWGYPYSKTLLILIGCVIILILFIILPIMVPDLFICYICDIVIAIIVLLLTRMLVTTYTKWKDSEIKTHWANLSYIREIDHLSKKHNFEIKDIGSIISTYQDAISRPYSHFYDHLLSLSRINTDYFEHLQNAKERNNPSIDFDIVDGGDFVENKWEDLKILFRNNGNTNARNIKIELEGDIKPDPLFRMKKYLAINEWSELVFKVKFTGYGRIRVGFVVTFLRAFDDCPYHSKRSRTFNVMSGKDALKIMGDYVEEKIQIQDSVISHSNIGRIVKKVKFCSHCGGKINVQQSPSFCCYCGQRLQ